MNLSEHNPEVLIHEEVARINRQEDIGCSLILMLLGLFCIFWLFAVFPPLNVLKQNLSDAILSYFIDASLPIAMFIGLWFFLRYRKMVLHREVRIDTESKQIHVSRTTNRKHKSKFSHDLNKLQKLLQYETSPEKFTLLLEFEQSLDHLDISKLDYNTIQQIATYELSLDKLSKEKCEQIKSMIASLLDEEDATQVIWNAGVTIHQDEFRSDIWSQLAIYIFGIVGWIVIIFNGMSAFLQEFHVCASNETNSNSYIHELYVCFGHFEGNAKWGILVVAIILTSSFGWIIFDLLRAFLSGKGSFIKGITTSRAISIYPENYLLQFLSNPNRTLRISNKLYDLRTLKKIQIDKVEKFYAKYYVLVLHFEDDVVELKHLRREDCIYIQSEIRAILRDEDNAQQIEFEDGSEFDVHSVKS